MRNGENPIIERAPRSFEKMILAELGARSLEEVSKAMNNNIWPFKIQPKELWKKVADYFDQPPTMADMVDLLTGNKTEEEVRNNLKEKQWPFNVSEEQMRKVAGNFKNQK